MDETRLAEIEALQAKAAQYVLDRHPDLVAAVPELVEALRKAQAEIERLELGWESETARRQAAWKDVDKLRNAMSANGWLAWEIEQVLNLG